MSKEMDELSKAYKDAYKEQTEALNKDRKEADALRTKHNEEYKAFCDKQREDRKPINEKVAEASQARANRASLEAEVKKIYNSLISGLANDEYDTAKVMKQAEAEAKLLIQ